MQQKWASVYENLRFDGHKAKINRIRRFCYWPTHLLQEQKVLKAYWPCMKNLIRNKYMHVSPWAPYISVDTYSGTFPLVQWFTWWKENQFELHVCCNILSKLKFSLYFFVITDLCMLANVSHIYLIFFFFTVI